MPSFHAPRRSSMLVPAAAAPGVGRADDGMSVGGRSSVSTLSGLDAAKIFPRGVWDEAESMEFVNVVGYEPKYEFIMQRLAEPL